MNPQFLEQIEKLSTLKEKGILSEAEFNEKKTVLLDAYSHSIQNPPTSLSGSGYWFAVPSMIFGIFVLLACLDMGSWDKDTYIGAFVFIAFSLVLGVVGISTQKHGKGMSIAGIVLSTLATLMILFN